jgi:hypothetical protein
LKTGDEPKNPENGYWDVVEMVEGITPCIGEVGAAVKFSVFLVA